MYEDILLPFDGSDGAASVLDHAAEIARWADATVHVLYVADSTRDSVTVVEADVVDALVREGEDVVAEATEALRARGVDHETDVVQGNPAPTIVEYAERYDMDLIAMATRGREGISRYLVGSVTEKVVRLSTVPVLTARMRSDERLAFPYGDVLVPTDGSAGATHAVDHALALATELDATVHVLAVADDSLLGPDGDVTDSVEAGEQAAADVVDDVVARAEAQGITNAVRHVERGNPHEVILETIAANDVDAVVMGTEGRRGTDRILLGSVAEKTVRSAPVPVVTVGREG